LGKTIALRFEIVRILKKPALYALKTLNFKLTLPSLAPGKIIPSFFQVTARFLGQFLLEKCRNLSAQIYCSCLSIIVNIPARKK
jgi:hypothetical protein